MKKGIAVILALLLVASFTACNTVPVPTATPGQSPTAEPTPEPTATPAPVTQNSRILVSKTSGKVLSIGKAQSYAFHAAQMWDMTLTYDKAYIVTVSRF